MGSVVGVRSTRVVRAVVGLWGLEGVKQIVDCDKWGGTKCRNASGRIDLLSRGGCYAWG